MPLYPFWPLSTYTPCQPPIHLLHPQGAPNAPLCHLYSFWFSIVVTLQLTIFTQLKHSFAIIVIFNCHHFATDHLHKYVQFTRYHLQVSRIYLQCCEAQPICAVSPKICTIKTQQLHNTERPTKWSGHGKMIYPPGEFLHMKDLLPDGVTIQFVYWKKMKMCTGLHFVNLLIILLSFFVVWNKFFIESTLFVGLKLGKL